MTQSTSGNLQPSTVGPTTPPGSQSSQQKSPTTFPEQTAQLVDVLKASNSDISQRFDAERARLEECRKEYAKLLDDKARFQEENAQLRGENIKLSDHLTEVRNLWKADRARHAIVAIIASAIIAVSGGMVDTTAGDTQTKWLIVLISGTVFLAVYSLLVYSDDIRRGLIKYGVVGGLIKVLFGKMFGSEELRPPDQ